MQDLIGVHIHITGIVQGVGFRPFIYSLAQRYSLVGWVRNTSAGVDIQIDTTDEILNSFLHAINTETPPLAQIDGVEIKRSKSSGFNEFEIVSSKPITNAFQPISPDVTICEDCLRELFDEDDRRYLYPFINCTNCGPRFTIIQDIPYDRPNTTMKSFALCDQCSQEYHNPLDRRFHAQPVACPICGPHVWLETKTTDSQVIKTPINSNAFKTNSDVDVIRFVQRLLIDGSIVAVKGLGGFHLACDALNSNAVACLRERKLRVDKPFALMMPDVETVQKYCILNDAELNLLASRPRPIVILQRKEDSPIASTVAPGQNTIGVMLPYTPLHYLLFSNQMSDSNEHPPPRVLVMTSGNISEEPIAVSNEEARSRLSDLADAFLFHDRPIQTRCDDSVVKSVKINHRITQKDKLSNIYPIRRSRGYAPFPIHLPWDLPVTLAVGAELKNVFCLTRGEYAFMSHHIGDMENYETYKSFDESIAHYEGLFRAKPQILAYDLHPDYLSTRYAQSRESADGIPAIGVQHHHAHIAACMAENGLLAADQVIGVAYDGIGYGEDGAIWGGELFIANYVGFQRLYHLSYVPLPGGDLATKEPWRMALSWISKAGIAWNEDLIPIQSLFEREPSAEIFLNILSNQIKTRLNSPLTSSMGRLFDAAAAILGIRQIVNYEAQAAIELEAICDLSDDQYYPLWIPETKVNTNVEIDPSPIIEGILNDLSHGLSIGQISARFHNSIAIMTTQACLNLRKATGINTVVLSGGVWQNEKLLSATIKFIDSNGFTVLMHSKVPTNDAGIALGQAAIAAHKLA